MIFYLCFLFSVFMFWDVRILLLFLLVTVITILAAGLSWRETRRTWLFLGGFISFYALVTLITGQVGGQFYRVEHVIAAIQAPFTLLGWQPTLSISIERIFLALSQLVRVASIAAMTILIPYTFDPALYGITFRRLGLPDKLAFALDLTMRFVPSLSRDFAMTMDAQKARGYELERREGGLAGQARKLAPLLVPVIVHSIISAEEITDAMDLRAFGTQPRTWLRVLKFNRLDYAVVALGLLMLAASAGANLLGYARFWAP
ncbi:MAG: energy-coupling factor transporter transmembrane protein EcfT [Chloroflexi bacterium]|nr:energy-coupling factor transporter transmembrane protein EcfT [Chloroflexota bacterium]